MVPRRIFNVENGLAGSRVAEERAEHIVVLGRALSDPIRVRMLGILSAAAAEGRSCCDLPSLGAPAYAEEDAGVCVCEFEDVFEMGQSKVSYHLRKLKEAGLVREERRGKWSFYSLDRESAGALLEETSGYLGLSDQDTGRQSR